MTFQLFIIYSLFYGITFASKRHRIRSIIQKNIEISIPLKEIEFTSDYANYLFSFIGGFLFVFIINYLCESLVKIIYLYYYYRKCRYKEIEIKKGELLLLNDTISIAPPDLNNEVIIKWKKEVVKYREKCMQHSLRAFLYGCILFAIRFYIQHLDNTLYYNIPVIFRWILPIDTISHYVIRIIVLLVVIISIILLNYLRIDFKTVVVILILSFILFVSEEQFIFSMKKYAPLLLYITSLSITIHFYFQFISKNTPFQEPNLILLFVELPSNIVFPLLSLVLSYHYFTLD